MIDTFVIRVPKVGSDVQGTLVLTSEGEELTEVTSIDLHFRPAEPLTATIVAFRNGLPSKYILEDVPVRIEVAE